MDIRGITIHGKYLIHRDYLENELGISNERIKKGIQRNKAGYSSWQSLYHGRNEQYIDLDTLPNDIKSKIGKSKKELIYEHLQKEKEAKKQKKEEDITKRLTQDINFAYFEGYVEYLPKFQAVKDPVLSSCRFSIAQVHVKNPNEYTIAGVHKTLVSLDIHLRLRFKSVQTLYRYIDKIKERELIIHGMLGNKNRLEFANNTYIIQYIEGLYSNPKRYGIAAIHRKLVAFCKKNELKPPSQRWVYDYFTPEVKNRLSIHRNGEKQAENKIIPFVPRRKAYYAGSLWLMDGSPMPMYCYDSIQEKQIRLNLYIILDSHSRKIVGFSITKKENIHGILEALKMAIVLNGHCAAELVHDNFSSHSTDEWKYVSKTLREHKGVIVRSARVGNAKDKGQVERAFRTFQDAILKDFEGYGGLNITTTYNSSRPSAEELERVWKTGKERGIEELQATISKAVNIYNETSISEDKSPNELYRTSEKLHIRPLNPIEISQLFWNKKTITIRNSMATIQIEGRVHRYEIEDFNLRLALNSQKVNVRYDKNDLEQIYLFDSRNNEYLCEAHRYRDISAAYVERSEEENKYLLSKGSQNQKFKRALKQAKPIEVISPSTDGKFIIQDAESKAMERMYDETNHISSKTRSKVNGKGAYDDIYKVPKKASFEEVTLK